MLTPTARILVVDDEHTLAENIGAFLRSRGFNVATAERPEAVYEEIGRSAVDLVLLDLRLRGTSGLQVFRKIQDAGFAQPVVIMSAFGTLDSAVEAMRLGAVDFLRKPFDLSELEIVVRRVLAQTRRKRELQDLRRVATQVAEADEVLGSDLAHTRVMDYVSQVARTFAELPPGDCPPVIIRGETGIGKNVVAGHLHRLVAGDSQPFVHVNCTAIQPTLFESELFGHERGAFTDAHRTRQGLFDAADGGTLFLDEIGHVPAAMQAKLLTAIEQKAIRRVGSSENRRINVRIFVSTNADLAALVAQGEFRSDLFYRISTIEIRLPPLRERQSDVLLLANHYLASFARKYGNEKKILDASAQALLRSYSWPGNIRELRNLMERAAIRLHAAAVSADELLSLEPALGQPVTAPAGLLTHGKTFDTVEKELLERAMQQSAGNVSAAARLLGMSRERFRSRWRITHR